MVCKKAEREKLYFLFMKSMNRTLITLLITFYEFNKEDFGKFPENLSWYRKPANSDHCAYILTRIECCDNPVTNVGRNPDAIIVNKGHIKRKSIKVCFT